MPRRRIKRKNRKGGVDGSFILFIIFGSGLVAWFSRLDVGAVVAEYKGEVFATFVFAIVGFILVRAIIFFVRKIQEYLQLREADLAYDFFHDLKIFQAMDPIEFEKYVGWFYRKLGYVVQVTKSQGDNGLDVLIEKKGERCAIQVKRYAEGNTVGEPAVREFYGSFRDSFQNGIFITTSDFTVAAREWVVGKPIQLINGKDFIKMVAKVDDSEWKQESTLIGNETKSTVGV